MIITGNKTVEYGMTTHGNLTQHVKIGNHGVVRVTTDPERFLRWIIAPEVNKEIEMRRRKILCRYLRLMWNHESRLQRDTIHSMFNEEHYLKVIQAKIDNGTLEF